MLCNRPVRIALRLKIPLALAVAALLAVPPSSAAAKPRLTVAPEVTAAPAKSLGIWSPSRFDSCPAALHNRYATRGPGGKLYPGWHSPVVRNPATGRRCTFGHEHGRDPRGSDLYRWAARHLGGGIPFGAASEALDAYAAANPGTTTRHEDHVGHKIEWQNDVRLLRRTRTDARRPIGVTCDFLTKLHQGSHSPDAFANNAHELIYAVRCDDGTRLLTTTFARISLKSRGLLETWASSNRIATPTGRRIASWNPSFSVLDPARYRDPALPSGLARTIDVCWAPSPPRSIALRSACDRATAYGTRTTPLPFDDPRSPFTGAHRETYFNQTTITNRKGPRRWYTDPYGRSASPKPFPGALCQLVSPANNTNRPALQSQSFGAERPYSARGVHAPN